MKFEIKEKEVLIFTLGLSIFLIFLTLIILNGNIKSINSKINTKKAEYQKALVLYEKIKNNHSNKRVFRGNILLFVQKLEAIKGVKTKIVSVNSLASENGVQIKMVGLDLPQIIRIFKTVESYGNIGIDKFILKRNFSSSNLADLNIILRKKI